MIAAPPSRAFLRARAILGALGVLIAIPAIGVALSIGTGGPLDPVAFQTRDLSSSLDKVERTLTRVESLLGSAGSTLDDTRTTATNGAAMTDALSASLGDLAAASKVQVLGIQPFAGLAPRFSQVAARASAVAASLRSTASDLQANRTQLDALAVEVRSLASVARRLASGGENGLGGPPVIAARLLLALFFAWLGATAGLSLFEALRQLRATPA